MIGARLFLQTENQPRGAKWRDVLRARSRAVRFYDRYPGVEIQLGADGYAATPMPHIERLRRRELLNLGSKSIDLDHVVYADPDRFPTEDLKYTCDFILDSWRVSLDRATSVAGFDAYGWGSVFPRVVFVGDKYVGERAAALPFSDVTGASATLSKLLDVADVSERDARFVNAYSRHGAPQLSRDALTWFAAKHVVALGSDAAEYLHSALGWRRFIMFPHPQYIREFSPVPLTRWGAKLKELLA